MKKIMTLGGIAVLCLQLSGCIVVPVDHERHYYSPGPGYYYHGGERYWR